MHAFATSSKPVLLILVATLLTGGFAAPAVAEDLSRYITEGEGSYTIDHEALANASHLSEQEKASISWALRQGEGFESFSIPGLDASCKIDYCTFFDIPCGGKCTVTASPQATKNMTKIGSYAVTAAICAVISVPTGEIIAPICELLLEPIVTMTIEPILDQCANKGDATRIWMRFSLPSSMSANAECL